MRKPREFYKGGFWHTLNRGVAKEVIFRNKDDFSFYLYKMKEFLKKYPITVHAYNLLDNHLHHLIQQTSEIAPSRFIGSLHTSFGIHINRKYSRVGHIFQDRYKAIEMDEKALLPASIYINFNKVLEKIEQKKKLSKRELSQLLKEAEKDPWGSYPVYLGLREDGITSTKLILSLLSDDIKKARKKYSKLAEHLILSGYFIKTRDVIFE